MSGIKKLVEELSKLSILEAAELVKILEIKWGIQANKINSSQTNIDKKGEKGTIKIKFFSHEELKNILDKLV